jgi:hypothetical protein
VFGWGSAAAVALAAAAVTSQTEAGNQRLQLTLAYMSEPVQAVAQTPPRSTEAETQRLAAEVRALAAEPAQLSACVASLERNLDDVTGSIKRQTAMVTLSPATSPPPAPMASASMPAVATAEPVPASDPPPLRKPLFCIDLGHASSVEALRAHWAVLKTASGPLLARLHPVVAQHPRQPAGTVYRLVAGPLPTIAAAAQLCARFPRVTQTGCRPARFSSIHLAEP